MMTITGETAKNGYENDLVPIVELVFRGLKFLLIAIVFAPLIPAVLLIWACYFVARNQPKGGERKHRTFGGRRVSR